MAAGVENMALQDQLRQAIADSGLTLYRVAKGSGVAYQVLHRFARGERDLTLETATRLADYFGMRLTRPRRPENGG
jgi:plasmid maintenance system antidote protein VapI